ncbi:SNF1 protein kinase subunit beta-3 [Meyerozyma sp. JA9]|nr:SNF1 protein kinase subunit beta-3 [Meyerozyma sp. JA9]
MSTPEDHNPGPENREVSMVDVSEANEDREMTTVDDRIGSNDPHAGSGEGGGLGRRKSTLILRDEDNDKKDTAEKMDVDSHSTDHHSPQSESVAPSTEQTPVPDPNVTVPVDIKWVQGGEKVYVTGSFTQWRKMIGLVKQPDNNFSITLGLPMGTHRFRFVVDNELRFSDNLPAATDQMGNFVNYVEVTQEHVQQYMESQEEAKSKASVPSHPAPQRRRSVARGRSNSAWRLTGDDDDMGDGYSRYHDEDGNFNAPEYEYINEIPPIFTDPKVMEQYYIAIDKQSKNQGGQQQAWLHPPQLPPHLENVNLNSQSAMDKDNNAGALPIPNHVVLNHLATTSIKHGTLAVASIIRYKRKYVTQVLYAPLQQ